MEEKKETLLNSWLKLKRFVYNYPVAWFMIGFLIIFIAFLIHFIYDHRVDYSSRIQIRSLLSFIIIFSFSIINIAANYDKSRSKFKWLFWDCLSSTYLFCFSFIYILTFIGLDKGFIYLIGYSNIDVAIGFVFYLLENLLNDFSFYTPSMSEKFNYLLHNVFTFESFKAFFTFMLILMIVVVYDVYKQKTIKEILRTRCFLIMFTLSLSRLLCLMAIISL